MDVFPEIKFRMPLRRLQRERAEDVMARFIWPIAQQMWYDIDRNTKWGQVRESYGLNMTNYYNVYRIQIFNSSPLWQFEEFGTAPHDIPQPPHFIPAGKLFYWIDQKGMEPAEGWFNYIQFFKHTPKHPSGGYWVTHHPGTRGDFVVQHAYNEYKPLIEEAAYGAMTYMIEPDGYVEY